MRYQSTRGQSQGLTFTEAFATGLAPDGGLYVPEELPNIASSLAAWEGLSYPELAHGFLSLFDTDHTPEELQDLIDRSYASFDAPLRTLKEGLHVLELFHGPTLAFKDFGLQLLGNLFEDQIHRTDKSINVLGATSGDTGAAAIAGLANKKGVKVFILFPEGRVSPLQERQMTCTGAENIYPIPIRGSFDDAQHIIKELFGDLNFKASYGLSAVNSINLARILGQCIYYLRAWLQLPAEERSKPGTAGPEFIVPTGNFGNVLAGWLASKMGLPIPSFQIATNQNDILHRLFTTGSYHPGKVDPSLAPSMDIQVASNFERYLFYLRGKDGNVVASEMARLKERGGLSLSDFDPDTFTATRSDDEDIREAIRSCYQEFNYIIDPHTACGFKQINPDRSTVILSTAHPAKFPETIKESIGIESTHPTLEALKEKPPITYPAEPNASAVRELIKKHA